MSTPDPLPARQQDDRGTARPPKRSASGRKDLPSLSSGRGRRGATRRARRRGSKPLGLEALEDRSLFNAAGMDELISPAWFAELGAGDALSHAGSGGWTSSGLEGPQESAQAQQNVYDWIVRFSTPALEAVTSVAETASLLVGSGVEFEALRGLGLVGQVLVRSYGAPAESVEHVLASNPSVDHFEIDAIQQLKAVPNDPSFGRLWGLENVGQTGGRADADIDAAAAWNLSTGSRGVVVGIIDTGVDYNHPDLRANMWRNPGEVAGNGVDDDRNGFVDDVYGYDFANNDANPMDDNSHGTHVAGTIGATGNNGTGVTGVNWNTSIMALKFLRGNGSGYTSDAVRALNYATMMRTRYGVNVRVTNNSWGGAGYSTALADAVAASASAGILFVAAAGNDGRNNDATANYPSSYTAANLLAVAATDANDNLASFSNFGAATVDLAAPGVSIYSIVPGSRYAAYSGTSMATPHVSGVAALAWAIAPNATVAEVRSAILQGADRLASLQGKMVTGGRLNAYNTLRLLAGGPRAPTIGALSVSPAAATLGATVTLTASGVSDPDGSVTGVSFYEDTNGSGLWDTSDALLGTDATIVAGEASLALSTAGYAPGNHTLLARAVDNQSQWSDPASAVLAVIAPDDHGNDATTATPVGAGTTTAGTIEAGGDRDWFALSAVAGRSYLLRTTLDTLPDSVLSLYGRDGTTLLDWNDDGGGGYASLVTWTAPASGTYFLEVRAYAPTQAGSYALTVAGANGAPVVAQIADQRISHRQESLRLAVDATDPDGDPLSYSAVVATGNPLVQDAAALRLEGNVLTISPKPGFLGDIPVEVSASDGLSTTRQSFLVSVTNDPPVLAAVGDQRMAPQQDAIAVSLSATDADGDPLVYTAQVLSIDPVAERAYELDQQLGLRFSRSPRTNLRRCGEKYMLGNGGRTYFILPNGELHLFKSTIRRSPLVATLSRAYYDNPALLYDARPPGLVPSDVAAVTVAGSELSIDPRAGFVGSFTVRVTASDGIATTSQSFQVVVSNATANRSLAIGPSGDSSSQPRAAGLRGIDPGVFRAVDELMRQLGMADRAGALLEAVWSAGLPGGASSWSWSDAPGNDPRGSREEGVLGDLYARIAQWVLSRPFPDRPQ